MGQAEGEQFARMPQLPCSGRDGLHQADPRAAEIHGRYLIPGEKTCIDCHKGIAHLLPDMRGVEPGWKEAPELQGKGSAEWRGHEREVLAYLAESTPDNVVLSHALCSAVDTAYCPIPTLWRVTCPLKKSARSRELCFTDR